MRENLGLALGVVGFLLVFVSAALRWHARRSRKSTQLADALGGAALLTIITAFILLPPE
ncbi:hypothetical protein [uncultured Sphingomonas sp.]|uniref:hypothetical protein n=1 Tax=uncultured Sphingomonas sp. TaxID=158754 RepID=UPI0026009F8C|nr:hypothetical protein [uncultured Sphingomonas sp.]